MSVTEPIVDSTTGNVILKPLAGIPLETLNSKANAAAISSSDKKETTTTATKAHTEGDYFELNGVFVKAIDDISVGDTLEEDVNIETTNVGDELEKAENDIVDINAVIPSDASATNQLLTPASLDDGDILTSSITIPFDNIHKITILMYSMSASPSTEGSVILSHDILKTYGQAGYTNYNYIYVPTNYGSNTYNSRAFSIGIKQNEFTISKDTSVGKYKAVTL